MSFVDILASWSVSQWCGEGESTLSPLPDRDEVLQLDSDRVPCPKDSASDGTNNTADEGLGSEHLLDELGKAVLEAEVSSVGTISPAISTLQCGQRVYGWYDVQDETPCLGN
jgi:hypothetical protein